ncbi:MAG: glutamine--fructose-6-phosphate transaminase (isomerizing) [Nitrospira bacterium HGW-Nitrospira-1]|nr:MAG: glutamine--fructose-6-phosphate transaminase (isomerizing) [Nitrospira bacterium HGW-Nitrospira-1]
MCGIIGYIGNKNAVTVILEGLKRLEYRGYDSAGIAFFSEKGIDVIRCKGKIKDLASIVEAKGLVSRGGIGHTRWATHGKPSEENAHPHRSGGIVVVHNGIIENYLELKKKLTGKGYLFESDTDTEALCHLIRDYTETLSLEDAVRAALKEVKGAYAIAVMNEKEPLKIVGVRKDSPLVVGLGDREYFLASDVPAFLHHSREVMFLDEGEMVVITGDGVVVTDLDGMPVQKEVKSITWSPSMAEKGGYRHFMLKEIFEQPRAVGDTIRGRFSMEDGRVNLYEFGLSGDFLRDIKKIFIVACGTSWHAGIAGKYMIEGIARMPVEVDVSSEFRYRKPLITPEHLMVVITQSGETADTLAAQREARSLGAKTLTICNVVGSTSAREADAVFYTHSGPEIGVASTKAFLTQVMSLYLLAIALGQARGTLGTEESKELLGELLLMPGKIEKTLATEEMIKVMAKDYFKARGFIYLGRGINYPIALEGALKLKEISYIHAEGYPAGEMKHGPIALIDEELPVVMLAPKDALFEKMMSNIQEVNSRGGKVIAITNESNGEVCDLAKNCIKIPDSNPYLTPMLLAIPLQLLAYHIGVLRGCDVDQPRNLAKSVTVE